MDLYAYLSRIGYTGDHHPSPENLRAIQRAHLLAVPFENLDIHLGRPIVLDEPALFDKIVTRRRGGFCYELNGLLALALEQLGYGVRRLSARGANDDGSYSAEFDHLLLRVSCPEPSAADTLVDVGWGNGPRQPLRLAGDEQRQEDGAGLRVFRLRPEESQWLLEERGARGLAGEGKAGMDQWVRHYRFGLRPYRLQDFAGMCRYHQTSPDSLFTRQRLVTRFTERGRVTLAGLRLIEIVQGARTERLLADEQEAAQTLRQQFGLID